MNITVRTNSIRADSALFIFARLISGFGPPWNKDATKTIVVGTLRLDPRLDVNQPRFDERSHVDILTGARYGME